MVGSRHHTGDGLTFHKRAPLLARNFVVALRALHDKRMVAYMIRMLGPQTAEELMSHCRRHLPHLSRYALNRALYALADSGVVVRLSLGDHCAPFWAPPGASLPPDAKARAKGGKAIRTIRFTPIPPAGQQTSWWAVPRDQFSAAYAQRWQRKH